MGGELGRRLRRFPLILLAPLLVFLTLGAWALASPVGSSPDDDFHLASIWCADAPNEYCGPISDRGLIEAPKSLLDSACYAYEPEVSAACQPEDWSLSTTELTNRANTVGGYPPVYYSFMNLFAGADVQASLVVMRFINVVLFTALVTALYLLLPVARRPALVWSWVLTTVPLGLFMLASNNPSSWTIMGVGFGWIALLGFFETDAKQAGIGRKVALGAIFALCAFMAAGSRGDGALYSILAIVAVGILAFSRSKRFLLEAILPLAVAVMCVMMYRFSRPVESVTGGVTSDSTSNFFVTVANNLLHVPSLWLGILGKDWGLGWLDTSMPAAVWVLGLLCFIGVGFVGMKGMSIRRFLVLAAGTLVLALMPAVLLSAAGSDVGTNLQPRYLLPLVVLFAGIMTLSSGWRPNRLTAAQWILIATALSSTQLLSLHIHMQRYVAGISNQSANIDDHIDWWWDISLSPMTVWVIGSVAYSALIFIVLHRMRRLPGIKPQETSDADKVVVEHA
ncbi:DUF2142 domain-containing protein [Cryobacterium sp. BB736]|uniref:DUF2142 domain-containing protein n=1 Tax=Cryobacterium sp. BB736 TaxID=2746963 RepID=UPI001D0BEC08|nr:DUF2142 domain-containing protein [Cryobacterium sp. BB736]